MTIFELMDSMKNKYTKTDLQIYEYIKKFPDDFQNKPISDLIDIFGFSQPSLTRFAKKLGFAGFSQFQFQLQNDIDHSNNQTESRAQFYSKFLEMTETSINQKDLNQIVEYIKKSDRIIFAGNHISSIPANYLDLAFKLLSDKAAGLLSEGLVPFTLHKNDVFILFSSYTGKGFKDYVVKQNEKGVHTILVTLTPKHPLRKQFETVFVLPESQSIHRGKTVLTETFAYFMFIDLLLERIKEKNKEN